MKASAIPLGGYAARRGARSTGVHDPVYARAIVVSDGGVKAAIVSVDLCFLPGSVKAEVLKRLDAGSSKWPAASLFLSATHTHCGPDPLAMHAGNTFTFKGWTPFNPALLAFTADRIAASITQAESALKPVELRTAVNAAVPLNRNRRGETLTDPALTLLELTAHDGSVVGAIVNYAAHPTLYDDKMMEISADWPGVMTQSVEKRLGAGSVCLFLNGAEGDASPNGVDGLPEDEKVRTYGERTADAAMAVVPNLHDPPGATLSVWTAEVPLPPRKPNAMYIAAAGQLGATFGQARQLVDALMPVTTTITFVRLGDALLVGVPCEPTAQLGLQMKAMARKAGYSKPAVVALTNAWLAYALMPEQYRKGNYEAMMSFYGDQLGPVLLTSVESGLKARPITEARE